MRNMECKQNAQGCYGTIHSSQDPEARKRVDLGFRTSICPEREHLFGQAGGDLYGARPFM